MADRALAIATRVPQDLEAPVPRRVAEAATRVERLTLTAALALGADAWDALAPASGRPSPFMSWAWHRAWSESAGAAEVAASTVIALFDEHGAPKALVPVLSRRVAFHRVPVQGLTWAIGDTGCPDHLDVLASKDADLDALVPALEALPWRVMTLGNLAPDAMHAQRLGERIAARGHVLRRRPLWLCPYLELTNDWERFLASLTPTRRQTVRRKERALRKNFSVTVVDHGTEDLEEGWEQFLTLHERRWPGAGAFRDPGVEPLHRRFAAEMAARGRLWLSTLKLDGAPAAAWYGFAVGDTVYFYQSGRDPEWESGSVGFVLMAVMIRRAIERGFRRFDFLRGDDVYKRQWTDTQRVTEEITILRRGITGRGLAALDDAAELRARFAARAGRRVSVGAVGDV